MSSRRLTRALLARVAGAVAVASAGGAAGAYGCAQTAPTVPYTPVTGIDLPSMSIVAGHGCGIRPDQVYRYVAVAYTPPEAGTPQDPAAVAASSLIDCFVDGLFSNLDGGPVAAMTGQAPFGVAVFAYNKCSFPPGLACTSNPVSCPAQDAAVALGPAAAAANWTTTCTATQVAGITAVAACAPLEPTEAGASCPEDGGADGGADGATGDGEAGDGEAGDAASGEGGEGGDGGSSDAGDAGGGDATADSGAPASMDAGATTSPD